MKTLHCNLLRAIATTFVAFVLMTGTAHAALVSCAAASTPTSFGNYIPSSSTANTSTGSVTVTCNLVSGLSLLVAYTVSMSPGTYGSYSQRMLGSGTNRLGYQIYTNAGMTTVWGDGTGGTTNITDGYLLGIGNVVLSYTAYGRIPALQNIAPGGYSDSIIVTVSY